MDVHDVSTSNEIPVDEIGIIEEIETETSWKGSEQRTMRRSRITWKIDYYLQYGKEKPHGQRITSPSYYMDHGKLNNPCQLQFILYPNGKNEHSKDCMSTYILLRKTVAATLAIELFFLKSDGTPSTFFKATDAAVLKSGTCIGKDRPMLVPFFLRNQHEYLSNNGGLRIGCAIQSIQENQCKYSLNSNTHLNDMKTIIDKLHSTKNLQEELSSAFPLDKESSFDHLSDVKIVCEDEGKTFQCHKVFLSLRSNVFKSYFEHETKEKKENKIIIKDMSAKTLSSLLHFIYTDEIDFKIDLDLMAAAQRYNVQRLQLICENVLLEKIDISNCLDFWVMSHYHQAKVLETASTRFIARNWATVKKNENFKKAVSDHPDLQGSVISYLTSST